MTKNLIWLRTDSIGDAVLAGSMLPYVAQRYSDLSITAVCQEAVAPYYESCPYVSQVISFHRTALLDDEVYRNDFIEKLRSLSAVLLLNSLYSRDNLSDFIATNAGALETITLKGDRTNRLVEESNDTDVGYSKVIPNGEHSREIDRHKHFLSSLGVVDIQLEPQFWYSDDDVSAVMSVLEQAHYQKDRYVVLIAGAQFDVRFYKQYGKALNSFCLRHKYPVVAIGAEADQEITEVNLKDLSCPYINLCGKTSLPQTAALLANAKIALGAETAGAHIAAAVKTPHVILLGGGHFGRFMPYSAYTSAVSLPLQCFACNWRCQFDQCYCVTDIAHEALTLALEETHQEILDLPRLFVQGRDYRRDSEPLVTWSMEETYKHLNLDMVRLIPLNNKNQ